MTDVLHARRGANHAVAVDALRVLVVRDHDRWFARGIEIDYSATGETLEDVQKRFERGFALTISAHLEKFQSLNKLLKWAPAKVIEEYEAGKDSFEIRFVALCKTNEIPSTFPYDRLKYALPAAQAA